jgi:cytochrome c oxidase assembly protein subunit 15
VIRRRRRELSSERFRRLSVASLGVLWVVVTSGAFVRLTDSGLGCDNWPRCGDKPYPEQGFHAFVEFGNRVVALVGILLTLVVWLAARRVDGLPRSARLAALGAFLGAVAQIPLGGITVILELHPLAVMSHFLLALAVVALAVAVVVAAWGLVAGVGAAREPRWLRLAAVWVGVPLCVALVVTGAVATASGPHSGSEETVQRLGLTISDTVYVHVRVAAAFSLGVLAAGAVLLARRREQPGVVRIWALLVAALVAQAVLGEVQYRNALPWGLVLVHVLLAATIWTATVGLAHVLWRPPRTLLQASPAAAREPLASSP